MRGLGLWTLPGAGVLYTVGVLLRGDFIVPTNGNAAAFAAWSSSSSYPVSYALVSAAAILAIFGYIALDRRLATGVSRTAMILAVAGAGALLLLFGALWFGLPAAGSAYTSGNHAAIDVAVRAYAATTPMQVLAILNTLGHFGFAAALWRSGLAARAGGVAFALAPVLQAFVFAYPLEIVGQVLFAAGALTIAVIALRPAGAHSARALAPGLGHPA